MIVEWIPYNNFQNIEFLTRGGCADIYTADWIGSRYKNWNPEQQQLILSNTIRKVVLKKLENIESANRSWFDERIYTTKSQQTYMERENLYCNSCKLCT
ncbi:hypothetical protein RhiirA1_422458 [Rhizophagus irregularis]|uniref:Uncharacterized protein n=1 Tax=Rhizophagus irregularis TaxID=588596 RepID=A0A2N0RK50_9GLOM|nr:hypothetical protein RhiirA1_422458 [Rhizophagus irregularis]